MLSFFSHYLCIHNAHHWNGFVTSNHFLLFVIHNKLVAQKSLALKRRKLLSNCASCSGRQVPVICIKEVLLAAMFGFL